ncbi:hypothetical protein Tco_0466023 [Tanacetum coccineum]
MFHNLDQLRLQLERENLHGVNAKTCLQALRTQFKEFLASKGVNATDLLNQGWANKDFVGLHALGLQLQSQDVQINPVQAVDDSLNVSKSSWIELENHNANLNSDVKAFVARPVNDQVPSVEVHLTVPHNVLATEQYQAKSPLLKAELVLLTSSAGVQANSNLDEHASNDVWTKQYQPRFHQMFVWTKQFKPRSSSNDVWTKQFKPRSSSKDVWTKQFRPRSSS